MIGCKKKDDQPDNTVKIFTFKSSVFDSGAVIPAKYTCDGQDVSPPLQWANPPTGTKSLLLVVSDPDAPAWTFIHWIVFNLPASSTGLKEGASSSALPSGTLEGMNHWSKTQYGGPCPPSGTHRYYFSLSALDITLSLSSGASKASIDAAVAGHILETKITMGKYTR